MSSFVSVLDVNIDNVTLVQATDAITEAGKDRETVNRFAFVNADCLNIAVENAEYRDVLNSAAAVFGDGSGVRYACKLTRQSIIDNVNGTDLFPLLCERVVEAGQSIYFLGGRPGVAIAAAERAQQRYPGLQVAGVQHGFFDKAELPGVIENINQSGANILLVAMGAPEQEMFIARHAADLKVGAAIGVGGLFDFLAREVGRASNLVRTLGFEWIVRWLNEPKRLLKRYFIGNPLFLWRVMRQEEIERQVAVAAAEAQDFRAEGSRFDLWQDFEVLDGVVSKYASDARERSRKQALQQWWHTRSYLVFKRGLDILAAGIAILLLSPVYLLTALAILIDDPGPIVFKQKRVGFRGRTFTMYKFRSMWVDAEARKDALLAQNESAAGVLFKMKADPRITRVGRLIRKFSIDELPQLFNVLLGDMTLVGPRPPVPSEVSEYSLQQRRRLEVVPGITCIWQVSGRSDIDFTGQVELDLQYIKQRSLMSDLVLLLKTIPAVILAKGAY